MNLRHFPRLACVILLLSSSLAWAQKEIPSARELDESERSKTFGSYTVHFSVFNSAFVPPAVAEIYQINRARNQVLVNISVTQSKDGKTSLGLPAKVSGTAKNLIQQMQTLDFQTISEGEATYYIAPLKHTNEEVYNFAIQVIPEQSGTPLEVRFSRKLYVQEAE
ncbi:DUF4426 domain-containing protein [Gilvimarinus sp. DA14]|uniref:DUF4426 domain-containing protein n=1 Tax=Gilvimarinus sp. DA14 TaxID=2956798 RepID=UPI0020B63E16|nr:DUF4426 domain-containing protein [Gilvimarinus sp. DA14]UTF59266.1 DUF4426 domain-containing protein [Gilvimarinus sp. DA14]